MDLCLLDCLHSHTLVFDQYPAQIRTHTYVCEVVETEGWWHDFSISKDDEESGTLHHDLHLQQQALTAAVPGKLNRIHFSTVSSA